MISGNRKECLTETGKPVKFQQKENFCISKLSGNLNGLKSNQIQRLKKVSEKRIREDVIISQDFARTLCELSLEIGKQIGILIDRSGYVTHVLVGSDNSIEIPFLDRLRTSEARLRGLRLVHTHLKGESLNQEDLTDLALLRLDYMTAVVMDSSGNPNGYYSAHLNPESENELWSVLPKKYPGQLTEGILEEILEIESRLSRSKRNLKDAQKENRAFLVGVYPERNVGRHPSLSMEELKELCRTAEVHVVDTFIQRKNRLDPSTVLGKGKLEEIILKAIQKHVELLVFDLELTPSQAKKISDIADIKVIDRTQLILDIFARNAKSRDGKLQVELAQLKYLKGRLTELDDNMSRLTGGIGGRGPGETKLEIGKRRVEERITRLEVELKSLRKRREINRRQRKRNELPAVGIVGYTNAGKSTFLNALTNSEVLSENKLFATLDPTTRRIRFPEEREIIISDTVGFIHDLPPELSNAFKATLEELGDSDLLVHVVDVSNPDYKLQMEAVEKILEELELSHIPMIQVFNKIDNLEKFKTWKTENDSNGYKVFSRPSVNHGPGLEAIADLKEELGIDVHSDTVLVSAYQGWGLKTFLDLLEERIYNLSRSNYSIAEKL
ncbi:GTPase HflX [Leptospira alexanderi]|uniref:GTPase HflX n=1 Tax=Leptospira alexanderi serovar Manhao 3 str. L 60 TaxID=1049759 RepID=V6IGA1_9LEPT|nr:GTPase HflX [Leptospira alexanderi]EQA64713.1 GTP-binding protein HflX [Leptospira alexanderi serovar Manhao 3 str. L 60]